VKRDKLDWLILVGLFTLTLVVFWQATHFDFIHYDDPEYVFQNDHVKHGITWKNIRFAFTSTSLSNWHPLTWLSYMLDAQLFGIAPAAFHRTNVVVHACSTGVLFLLLLNATGSRWQALLAGVLFGLHPLRVESVAWVAERKDVLSVLFALLSLLAYVAYTRGGSRAHYACSWLLFATSLLAKPMLLTLPFVMLLLDYWPLARPRRGTSGRRLLVEKLPMLALTCASAAATLLAAQTTGALNPTFRVPLAARAANAVLSTGQYLCDMVWPTRLAILYPFPRQPQTDAAIAVLLLLLAVTLYCVSARSRWPHLLVGWCWFLGTLTPVNGFVSIGEIARADRYTYFPMIGIILMAVWSIPTFARRSSRLITGAAAGVGSIALVAATHAQLQHWRSSSTIFERAISVIGPNATIEMNWGVACAFRGDHDGALEHLGKAWALAPGMPALLANYANELQSASRIPEAIALYRDALRQDPNHPMVWHNLGVAYMNSHAPQDAERCFRQVLRLRPDFTPAQRNLDRVLAAQGKAPE